jgi:orotate phosphoribosyltransferase
MGGPALVDRERAAALTARMLLEVGAIHFRPHEPFVFTSGWASPVYIDCRKLIAFPRLRRTLMGFAEARVLGEVGFESLDAVAGGETAGIPFAAWLADRLMLPMAYVRKKPKGFGRNARIEGDLKEGARVLLVEDLNTDGRSKVAFAEGLREAGAEVRHVFVVFDYGIFPHGRRTLAEAGLTLHALTTWRDALAEAERSGALAADAVAEVARFLDDPVGWSAAHGGKGEVGA